MLEIRDGAGEGVVLGVPAVEDVDRAASVVGAVVHVGDEEAVVRRHGEEANAMQAGERDVDLKIPGQRERDGAAVGGGKRMGNQRLLRGCGEREKKKQDEHAAGHAASVAGDVHRRQVHAALRRSANGVVEREAEACVQLATAVAGEGEDAAVELLRDPAFFQGEMKQGCAECAAQVGTALAPVQTGVGEAAAEMAGGVDVDTERSEGAGAFGSEAVGVFTGVMVWLPLAFASSAIQCRAVKRSWSATPVVPAIWS